ncbi:MAG: hypothetical protein GWP04_12060 [Gammaproteobacteria bacterium]|nr:hypothetical protein [Gammaproteobacteria bacterium]
MITLSVDVAVAVVATVGVLGGLWGGMVSTRSALNGPEWAMEHLRKTMPIAVALSVLSIVVLILVRPTWVGIGVLYTTGMVAFMSRGVSRSLQTVADGVGLAPITQDGRQRILLRSARMLIFVGAALAVIALLDYRWRGAPARFDWVLVAMMLIPGVLVLRKAGSAS